MLLDATYPNSLHFQLTTPDELYDIFVTILSKIDNIATIEIYSPQTLLFNTQQQIVCDNDVNDAIISCLQNHLHQIGFDSDIM